MADTSAMAEIRGIDVNEVAVGYADEMLMLKKLIRNKTVSSRELRWYTKTAGYLDSTDTTAITASQIYNTSMKSLPVVVEQSWTRTTSYVKYYKVESPWIAYEDLKDNDIDIWSTHLKDLVEAVSNQVDARILAVVGDTLGTGGNVNTAAAVADGWDDAVTGDPIQDILTAKENIRTYRYDPEGAIMYIHPGDYTSLIQYLISVKGSSIPNLSSELAKNGVVYEILNIKVMVSTNASEDTAIIFKPDCAVWAEFTPLTTHILDDPGIAKKIRVVQEGECLLEHPRAVHVITDIKV